MATTTTKTIDAFTGIEPAIIGTREPGPEKPVNTQRVVRSFDPCSAGRVH